MALGVRGRVLLLIGIAIMPGIASTVYLNVQHRSDDIELARATLDRVTEEAVLRHETALDTGRQLLLVMSAVPEIRERQAGTCDRLLAAALAETAAYATFGVIEVPDGLLSCTAIPTDGPVYATGQPYFQRVVATGGFAVGDYQVDRVSGQPTIKLGLPLFGSEAQLEAVLFAALDLAWLSAGSEPLIHNVPGSVLVVLDGEGTILIRQPGHEAYVGRSVQGQDNIMEAIRTGDGSSDRGFGLDGVERFYHHATLPGHPDAIPVYVVYGIPVSVVLGPVQDGFQRGLLLSLGGALIAFVIAIAVSEYSIVRRLRIMTVTTDRLEKGDLSARTGLLPGRSDLDIMAATIDRMAEQFERLDKTKMDLINNTAHEMATPLTPMKLSLDLLSTRMAGNLDPVDENALASLRRNTERLARVVDGVVAVARFQSGALVLDRRRFDLDEEISRAVGAVEARAASNEVRIIYGSVGQVEVKGDPTWIGRVLDNYLENAVRFTPPHGHVRVHLRGEGGKAVVEMQDSGVGFEPHQAQHLFQPFNHAHDAPQSTEGGIGLGLYMGRIIVERHGGQVWAKSEGLGAGATFGFDLPLHEPGEAQM